MPFTTKTNWLNFCGSLPKKSHRDSLVRTRGDRGIKDHDRGLAHDLPVLIDRRRMLAVLGACESEA